MALMAFQCSLLEDILDSVLHIATSFKIVGAEAKLIVLNAAVDRKLVFSQHICMGTLDSVR